MKADGAGFDMTTVLRFDAVLFCSIGKGAWTFAPVPTDIAPPVMASWGMTPVIATVDGKQWPTTVWKDKSGRSLLPVPKKIRGRKVAGDTVQIELRIDRDRAVGPAHPLE
jgi:Domain of unknown function (DUF1905)